jgi:hypothetical protein
MPVSAFHGVTAAQPTVEIRPDLHYIYRREEESSDASRNIWCPDPEREHMRYATTNNISAVVLKVLGDQKGVSFDDLQRVTGLLPGELQQGISVLQSSGLIEGSPTKYSLTERGDKARYFVAS